MIYLTSIYVMCICIRKSVSVQGLSGWLNVAHAEADIAASQNYRNQRAAL